MPGELPPVSGDYHINDGWSYLRLWFRDPAGAVVRTMTLDISDEQAEEIAEHLRYVGLSEEEK